MIKCEFSSDGESLKRFIRYISGTAEFKEKAKLENVTCDSQIKNSTNQEDFLEKYAKCLKPRKVGQRQGKRVALKLTVSWLEVNLETMGYWLDDFMSEHFPNAIWTYAHHQVLRNERPASHFHILICPRLIDSTMINLTKSDIQKFQKSFLDLSDKYHLKCGWDNRIEHPQRLLKAPRVKRKRKSRTSRSVSSQNKSLKT